MTELQELIKQQFQKDNFLIQNSDTKKDEKWAVIYCSSNGVYAQDTVEDFTEKILKIDNYEWYMNRIPYADKHIFIRDVSKRFYQFGINNDLNTLEKVAEMLKKETEGYKTITIGSSAGGMMAVVLAKMLNAEFAIAFSPIFRPFKPDEPEKSIKEKLETKEYFDVLDYAKSNVPIFFIYPNGSEWDIYESSLVKDLENIHFLPIISKIHGVPINKRILKKILHLKKNELQKAFKYKTTDAISEYTFARQNWGFGFYLLRVFDYIKKYPLFFLRKDFYTLILR